jgi:phospholipase/carboxylesterase
MGLSTFLPLGESIVGDYRQNGTGTPVFMAHGRLDEVVPCQWGELSATHLKSIGYKVEWHTYNTGHGIGAGEISDIRSWLMAVLGDGGG